MFSLKEKQFPKKAQKVQTLIIGRLMAIFLLLIAGWLWHEGQLKLSFETFPRDLFIAFITAVGLTIVYFFVLRLSKNLEWQIKIQFLVDALLITWLVWRTGTLTSPYLTLYIILIGVSSVFTKARETLLLASLCALFFTAVSIGVTFSFITSFGSLPDPPKIVQIIGFHVVAFFVVGLLAARLSDRSAHGENLIETKKSLENLRLLHERIIESIRSGLITTDLEGNIYTFNAAATEITGYTAKEMNGKNISLLLGNIEQPIITSFAAVDNSEQQPRFEAELMTPERFAVRIGYGIAPLFSEKGEKSGLIVTFQDLTDIRSMEESSRRKDRLAAVGRVAAGLAHEIRNPLGAMRGAIQVLESSVPKESTQASLMDIILRESDRLNKIITNFLTYARPRAGNFSELDVCQAIGETVVLLKHSPDVKDFHKISTNLPENPIIVSADSTQMKQIFWNLARNALNAMPNGGELVIQCESFSHNRSRITFSDTGCGMSASQVEQLFEPFSESTTGGTGLGLSIVYQIVRDHGGTINVKSLENAGTTISVEFPSDLRLVQNTDNEQNALTENDVHKSYKSSRIEGFLNVQNK